MGRAMMRALQVIASCLALIVGAAGFLGGQLFFGTFSMPASLAGVSGVLAGALGLRSTPGHAGRAVTALVCALGLLGVALDALHYYRHLDIPGNYYAWSLVGPFLAALGVIGCLALVRN